MLYWSDKKKPGKFERNNKGKSLRKQNEAKEKKKCNEDVSLIDEQNEITEGERKKRCVWFVTPNIRLAKTLMEAKTL